MAAPLRTIIEELIEESEANLSRRSLDELLEAAEKDGKLSVEPQIRLDGDVGEALEPEIKPFGPKTENTGKIPAHSGDIDPVPMGEPLIDALRSLNKSIKSVDMSAADIGSQHYLAEPWWKEVRKEIMNRDFEKAKFNINNFRSDLHPTDDKQQALAEALERLVKHL